MTDERIDALIRRMDEPSSPGPEFVRATALVLQPLVRAARVQDTSRIGRLRRDLRLAVASALRPSVPRPLAAVGLVILLLLAALAAAIFIGGALDRLVPLGNGPLIIEVGGEIRAIDVDSGSDRPIVPASEGARYVSRSPDGRSVAYWKVDPGGDQLAFVGIDGQGRRRVALPGVLTWAGCVDTWSPDSRYLASEVKLDGASRILVSDSRAGIGRFVTPDGMIGHCPLWSPDSESIAFAQETPSGSTILAVIRADGSGLRGVSGDIGGANVAGANSWSEDGIWIYFTASPNLSIWRAQVAIGTSTQLADSPGIETAVAASPDGKLISWIVGTSSAVGWDLYVANSDGTEARRLLEDAWNLGWSADSRFVLARWSPGDRPGGITLVSPDGTDVRVVVPTDKSCLDPNQVCDVGWGQARP